MSYVGHLSSTRYMYHMAHTNDPIISDLHPLIDMG